MGRRSATKFRDIVGMIKDKAWHSRAALSPLSKPHVMALLRATTHHPSTPPEEKYLLELLSYGRQSRSAASAVIESLMDRLQTTGDAPVAVKCLLTIHHIIRRGSFILHDQLSVFPWAGGRNYLKLSNFRDGRTSFTWEISSYVRWYARYIEDLLSTSRMLGFFICSNSSILEKKKSEEAVTGRLNSHLLRDIDSLVYLIEDTCKMPESTTHLHTTELLRRVKSLVAEDHVFIMNEVTVRVKEFRERLGLLNFGESIELVCALKRLEICEEKLSTMFELKVSMESLWGLVREPKCNLRKGEEVAERRVVRGSESARYDRRRTLRSTELVNFSSGRLLSLPISLAEE
ncbi:hypothetical protein SAY86_031831 [Trapa natans]|uniref:ENTH domain-containing protein n=1 Tax=Trapa natans TaxID=22666 RepID=A0AAN7RA29_TRANT|nr:hypothetical protein SAY86_031831 [Trapa natans]